MVDYQLIIEATRRRIGLLLWLRASAWLVSGALLIWGSVILILHGVLGITGVHAAWGCGGVLAAIALAGWRAYRQCPSPAAVRALVDRQGGCGGLLMSASEANLGGWVLPTQRPLPQLSIRWDGRRQVGTFLLCTAFLSASFFVPPRVLGKLVPPGLDIQSEVDELAEKLELLEEEKFLPPDRAESLQQALEDLQREAAGADPAKTWEALDHLEASIAKASAEAAQESERKAEDSAGTEQLASALDQVWPELEPETLTEAMKTLAKDINQAKLETALLNNELPKELMAQIQDGTLDPGQLSKLSQSLGKCKACELGKLKKLADLKLIDPKQLKKIQGQCQRDPDALAKLLAECEGAKQLGACLAACKKPGRGGVTRGRGDAEMTWTDTVNREGVTFKDQALSPGAAASLDDAQLQGVSTGVPDETDQSEAQTSGGALDPALAGRGSARTQVILPEHKKVVKRYFDRESPTP